MMRPPSTSASMAMACAISRLEVDDADQAFAEAVRRGAQPAEEPHDVKDEHGAIRRAAVHTYGDTIHSLISYKDYKGPFLPGFMAAPIAGDDCGILRIDHIVGNVELGKMQHWADYYTRVFGFHRYITFDDKDISTEYSALMSIVMSDDSHSVKFPINEPAPGRKKSQIEEYIEAYGGAGAQHIALQCKDVMSHGRQNCSATGSIFCAFPTAIMKLLPSRVGEWKNPSSSCARWASWWTATTKATCCRFSPSRSRIARPCSSKSSSARAAADLAKGNFKALFESIEMEQARRGNL